MVRHESGFNQSETDSGKCARTVWRLPGSPATAKDDGIIQRQHFCHHGGTINLPSEVKLCNNETARNVYCGCNNNAIYFQTELFSRFPPSLYASHANLSSAKHWRFMPK